MCGIVGFCSSKNVVTHLLSGLKKLEYRGYDSAGIAVMKAVGDFEIIKKVGPIACLTPYTINLSGVCGLAHTRWATHGVVSEINAHPHESKDFFLVHNGIIFNEEDLRKTIHLGCLISETDSEVVLQLLQEEYNKTLDVMTALQNISERIKGSYAFVIMSKQHPDALYWLKTTAPLVVGLVEDRVGISSDVLGLEMNNGKMFNITNHTFGCITLDKVVAKKISGDDECLTEIKPPINHLSFEKGNYPHFFIKEIEEQSEILQKIFDTFIAGGDYTANINFGKIDRIIIVGCGSCSFASMMGKLYLEKFLTYPVSFEYSHEFIHKLHVLNPKVLMIAVSQSGETADTLHCVEMANAVGCQVIAFCNRSHSLMARLSTKTIDLMCGPEHSVASTKTFTSSIFNFYLFSISVAKSRGLLMRAEYNHLIGEVKKTALFVQETSQEKNAAATLANMLAKFKSLYFIGRKWLLPMALEAAHKCKELTYLHAEGYPSAELKHGAISMIGSDFPTVILVGDDETIERMVATAKEIKARRGILYIVGPQKLSEQFKFADSYFAVPAHFPDLQPIVTNIFLQYMNYFLALKLERNVDQPRNLAKTVTVE